MSIILQTLKTHSILLPKKLQNNVLLVPYHFTVRI